MSPRTATDRDKSGGSVLLALGVLSLICYAAVTKLSFSFVVGQGHAQRPILLVLLLYGVCYAAYLGAAAIVWRRHGRNPVSPRNRVSPLWLIWLFAVAFRLVQLFANPIQEIDIYRYLWDGRMTLAGINPYAYSPEGVEELVRERVGELESERRHALSRVLQDEPVAEIFQTVDHRSVPTVYPPVSQAVFAFAALLTPPDLPVRQQIIRMKTVLLGFDLGVIWLLILLLRRVGRPAEWCIAYAWCPLVVKEVANSGHIDVVAVFFTVLAVLLISDFGFWISDRRNPKSEIRNPKWGGWRLYAGTMAWAAAVLAKVYPIVLLPLLIRRLWDIGRWRALVGPMVLASTLIAGTYAALSPRIESRKSSAENPLRGLRAFVTEWEMNDLVFHLLHRGVDSVLGEELQRRIVEQTWWPQPLAKADAVEPSFVISYALTGVLLGSLIVWLAIAQKPGFAEKPGFCLPAAVFYILAAMFLLSPTANPWYLVWLIPFLPWARQASWFLLPGVIFHYYLRFWFEYHFPVDLPGTVFQYYMRFWFDYQFPQGELTVPGSALSGRDFFNQVWLWVEYLPFFAVLALELVWRRIRKNDKKPQMNADER